MLKKLDKFIIKSFIGPFTATFLVALFILIMQFVWKYVDDFAGKGIESKVLVEFFVYLTAGMVPLALPLGIMVASIMLFGNLAERYELAAMKASGISIQRIMLPLIFLTASISFGAFLYSNYVLPIANLKSYALLYSITEQKPAVNLKEGIFFNGIENFSIRVGKRDKNGIDLYDLMIYNHLEHRGTDKVIYAKKGMMTVTDSGHYMRLTLHDGYSYEEVHEEGKPNLNMPFIRNKFKLQELKMDLSAFKLKRANENDYKDNASMLNLRQLDEQLDTIKQTTKKNHTTILTQVNNSIGYFPDSAITKAIIKDVNPSAWLQRRTKDEKLRIIDGALNLARNNKSAIDFLKQSDESEREQIVRYKIEWHKKITLAVACLILFFIGAPLGSIIKKGGLGMPMVVSVLFFVVFHVLGVAGEKMAKEATLTVFGGMWLASGILLPIGIFLTYKATTDSALFNADSYINFFKKLFVKNK
ncbi:MAG: LptF/LptG family permease [Bacteroidia bacterium]